MLEPVARGGLAGSADLEPFHAHAHRLGVGVLREDAPRQPIDEALVLPPRAHPAERARGTPDRRGRRRVAERPDGAVGGGQLAVHRHRRKAGDPWFNELSHQQVAELLARHGFTIVAMRGFALCPPGAYAAAWLRPLARRMDGLAWRVPGSATYATNVLYVARRTTEPA